MPWLWSTAYPHPRTLAVFREEELRCATRLEVSGIPTELRLDPGVCYGCDLFASDSDVMAAFQQAWQSDLRLWLRW